VQTFLPFASFEASAAVLDDLRLGKQRVETLQILRAIVFPSYKGWRNHPASAMWRGFTTALACYGLATCAEWVGRGRADSVAPMLREFIDGVPPSQASLRKDGRLPPWFGDPRLHASHRASLTRKLPEHYRPRLPDFDDELPYFWPVPVLPRWPLREKSPLTEVEATKALAAIRAGEPEKAFWLQVLTAPDPVVLVASGARDWAHPPLAGLRPEVVPPRRPSRPSVSVARPPTTADVDALRAETSGAPWLFAYPARDWARRRSDRAGASVVNYGR